jgi:lycopene cyclase domain-containing protein
VTYFQTLILVYLISLVANKIARVVVYPKISQALILSVIFILIGYVWEGYCLSHGHWTFNEKILLGTWVGGLPVEEYLFFVIVPYLCISVYKIVGKYFK